MKWLSTLKYIPPEGSWLIVRLSHVDGWETYTSAKSIRLENEKEDSWSLFFSDLKKEEYKITHFCIPDAVEREQ